MEEVKDLPPDQLIVKIEPDGKLEINGNAVEPDAYVATLRDRLNSRSDKTVFVLADDQANYARLVLALDGAKAAGATTLGMATDTPSPPTP